MCGAMAMIIQADIKLLQQAIRQLSRREREELAEWILNSPDIESRVAEIVVPYGGRRYFTVDEYMQLEEENIDRHEYVAGFIYAMGSPVLRHEIIVANVCGAFHNQLRGTPCRAFGPKMKLRFKVHQEEIAYFPDVQIACGPFTDNLDARWLLEPCVVVEVLSPSTVAIDRREKALNYRQISSLEEYLVIAQWPMEVTIFRRSDNWRPIVLTSPEDVYESRSVEVNLTLAAIYDGVQ
jgi:Uma2 family endonuclease